MPNPKRQHWETSRSRSSGWKPGDKAFDCITRPCFPRRLPFFRRRPLYRFIGPLSTRRSPFPFSGHLGEAHLWHRRLLLFSNYLCDDFFIIAWNVRDRGLAGYQWAALSISRESLLGKWVRDLGWEVCAETRGLHKQTYPPSPVFSWSCLIRFPPFAAGIIKPSLSDIDSSRCFDSF